MKTLSLITLHCLGVLMFLTFSPPVFSQAWVPLGTEWSFTDFPYDGITKSVSKIKAVEELMDEGRMVTKLVVESQFDCPFEPDWVYAYTTPEKEVFMKLAGDTAYVKYFDFSVQAGDQLLIPFKVGALQEEMRVYIDSVDTVRILNELRIRVRGWIDLKWLVFVEQPEFCWIEGIGDTYTSMFLGQSLHCGADVYSCMNDFRCFKNEEEGIYNPENVDCDEILSSIATEIDNTIGVKFFPNPVKNELFFDSEEFDSWTAEFHHVSGLHVHSGVVSGKSLSIPESLATGMYFIHLTDKMKRSVILKVFRD